MDSEHIGWSGYGVRRRTAAERLSHGYEFGTPALVRPEITRQCVAQPCARFALVPKSIEEKLVQDHRVHRDELLALETVEQKARGIRVIELGQLLVDQIEAFDCPAVVVLVV